jgi:hypothetical protein
MEVLGGLVALPVSFAAERLSTVGECAAIRSLMAFLVFSVGLLELDRI